MLAEIIVVCMALMVFIIPILAIKTALEFKDFNAYKKAMREI